MVVFFLSIPIMASRLGPGLLIPMVLKLVELILLGFLSIGQLLATTNISLTVLGAFGSTC